MSETPDDGAATPDEPATSDARGEPATAESVPAESAPAEPASEDDAPAAPGPWWKSRALRGWVVALVVALGLSLVLRTYCFESYWIPSSSMVPTLQINDRVVVDKLSVDFGTINVGDIVVFKSPPAVATRCSDAVPDLVKRVVGLPGDTIWSKGNTIYLNGKALKENWPHVEPLGTPIVRETIPAGQYYMVGDNHPNSCDSRYWGTVPRSDIIGKVFLRYWPLSRIRWI
jgi:signal peptidase I